MRARSVLLDGGLVDRRESAVVDAKVVVLVHPHQLDGLVGVEVTVGEAIVRVVDNLVLCRRYDEDLFWVSSRQSDESTKSLGRLKGEPDLLARL